MKKFIKMKRNSRRLVSCVLLAAIVAFGITGCKEKEESTTAQAEVTTAVNEESSKLDSIDLETYKKLGKEEKQQVLALYLEKLYQLEETKLPEGEEYEEVLLALKPALESLMRNHPDKTMQELLDMAEELNDDPEGVSIEEFFAENMEQEQ